MMPPPPRPKRAATAARRPPPASTPPPSRGAFIREQRQELREQLIAAAREGLHPFPDGAVHGEFVESGVGATEADLDALDDTD